MADILTCQTGAMLLDLPSYPADLTDEWLVLVLVALAVLVAAITLIVVLRRRGRARTPDRAFEPPTTAPAAEPQPGPASDEPTS